jgi:lipopolysaccharide export system permease protein
MRLIDRYLFATTLRPLALSLGVVLAVLLLERVLRLFALLVDRRGPIALVLEAAANLIPHYLGLALPAAFFLSILLVTARLSADNELDALGSSGVSLARLAAPFFGLAAMLVALGFFLYGFAQPYSRYSYRAVVHAVTHGVWDASLREGVVLTREDALTITADTVDASGRVLGGVFIHQQKDGETLVTTAEHGRLGLSADGTRLLLALGNGIQLRLPGVGPPRLLEFAALALDREFRFEALPFRVRGASEREMTLAELWEERRAPSGEIAPARLQSEWHGRLARIVSPLVLPLVAMPLGLASRRAHRTYGIVVAVLILVLFHHAVQLGESLADLGAVPAAPAIWSPMLVFAALGLWIFRRADARIGENPLARAIGGVEELLRRGIRLARGGKRAELGT